MKTGPAGCRHSAFIPATVYKHVRDFILRFDRNQLECWRLSLYTTYIIYTVYKLNVDFKLRGLICSIYMLNQTQHVLFVKCGYSYV